jgi:hypothetical protein
MQTPLRSPISRLLGLGAAAVLLVSGLAIAQPASAPQAGAGASAPATCEGMGPMGGPGRDARDERRGPDFGREAADPTARVQEHLSRLKTDLKITPAQDKAWQAFATQATKQAEAMKARLAKRPDPKDLAKLSAPERMAQHLDQMKQHLVDMEGMNKAVKDLYGALTPDQKTTADKLMARLHAGHGDGGDRDGRGDRGHRGHRG